jgi:hypothetical protein
MNTRSLLFAVLTTVAASGPAAAVGRWVDLTVYDRTTQQELPVYLHDGRYYIAGQPGHRYQIRLRSREGERVLGVLSVDGVNVISGDTADWSQTGYVLGPYAWSDIRGWRKSLAQVADFVFADAAHSYASRTGRPDNVGVIGMAVFRERPRPRPIMPMAPMPMPAPAEAARAAPAMPVPAPPAPAAASAAPIMPALSAESVMAGSPLGTGHGPREDSQVSYTAFTRASSTPDEVVTLYYDTRERLIAQGVIPASDQELASRPEAFPGHFVPDPH